MYLLFKKYFFFVAGVGLAAAQLWVVGLDGLAHEQAGGRVILEGGAQRLCGGAVTLGDLGAHQTAQQPARAGAECGVVGVGVDVDLGLVGGHSLQAGDVAMAVELLPGGGLRHQLAGVVLILPGGALLGLHAEHMAVVVDQRVGHLGLLDQTVANAHCLPVWGHDELLRVDLVVRDGLGGGGLVEHRGLLEAHHTAAPLVQ